MLKIIIIMITILLISIVNGIFKKNSIGPFFGQYKVTTKTIFKSTLFKNVFFEKFSTFFFLILYILKFIFKPIILTISFFISFLSNLGDMSLAHRIVLLVLTFLFKKICYFFWYIKKYWIYKPMRFFYIYLFIYVINVIPKNRDLGFEDTFFFRGYKLYFLKNSYLIRRYFFSNHKLKVITPEGYFWKNIKWNKKIDNSALANENIFSSNVFSRRTSTDISLFFNIWSKTKKGKFWFLNKDVIVNFPKINEFSFGTEFKRVYQYKSWKHSFLNRLIYQSPYVKTRVAHRMLDYTLSFNENSFSVKNSFSYFFNFHNSYIFYPFKGVNKNLKLKSWSYSEKFLFNRDSQMGFKRGRIIRKSMAAYYSKVSKLHHSFPYDTDNEKSGNLAKSMENLYSYKKNFFNFSLFNEVKNGLENGYYDEMFSKTREILSKFTNKLSRDYFINNNLNSINKISKIELLKDIWSFERIYSYALHKNKAIKEKKTPGLWDSYFRDMVFLGKNGPYERTGIQNNTWEEEQSLNSGNISYDYLKIKNNSSSQNIIKQPEDLRYIPNFLKLEDYLTNPEEERILHYKKQKDFKNLNIFNLKNYVKKRKEKKVEYFDLLDKNLLKKENNKDFLNSYHPSSLMLWYNFLNRKDVDVHSKIISSINSKENMSPFVYKNLNKLKIKISNKLNSTGLGELKQTPSSVSENKEYNENFYFFTNNPLNNLSTSFLNGGIFSNNLDLMNTGNYPVRNIEEKYFNEFNDIFKFKDLFNMSRDYSMTIPEKKKEANEDSSFYYNNFSNLSPNLGRLYSLLNNSLENPSNLERIYFTNNLLKRFSFVLDPKYLDNDQYYQVYPALFNTSNVDFIFTTEFEDSTEFTKPKEELDNLSSSSWKARPFLELEAAFEYDKLIFSSREQKKHIKMLAKQKGYIRPLSEREKYFSNFRRIKRNFETDRITKFKKIRQISQDLMKPDYNFYNDSVRYSNMSSADFLKKIYREEAVLRNNSFFNPSNINYDIKNYRMNHLYSKIFFEKNFRERNFFNSKTDRAFFQKQKLNTLSFPNGKLKSPTKYDYYYVNKIGNRGFIDYKASSKFLNENYFVNYLKMKESKFFSFIWNELPSNFIFVELKYLFIDFFHNKAAFLNASVCFTFTRILLSISDRLLYEFISAIKIYVISWFSVLIDDFIGLYMRYYLILLDHNTLLFVSRKNVSYGSYTIVKTRDRSFENKRLFGLRDMRRRFYKGVEVNYLLKGSKMNNYDFDTDIYKFNTIRKKYTKIRGNNYGIYDKYITRRSRSQSRKHRSLYVDPYGIRKKVDKNYQAETKRSVRKLIDVMFFSNVGHKGSGYFNRKAHTRPQNNNRQGFIVLARSKVTFKPGKSFRFGKLYMKFRFRPVMLRFSNSTYFFRYKNLSSSLFTEYNRFPIMRRKFFDFFKYSDISFKSKNKTRNLKILPSNRLKKNLRELYKNKIHFYKIFTNTSNDLNFYKGNHIRLQRDHKSFFKHRRGFYGNIEKKYMVSNSYGINDFLMRYSVSFKFLNSRNNYVIYNSDFYINRDVFDNFFLYNIPVNYKLRFIKIKDMLMIDFIKWKKYYVEGHSSWIGENARIYNLDFYKNSNIRKYKRYLKYKSKKFKIRQIPYKIDQRYSFNLYKNPFLKTKDSDFIKSLFIKKSPKELPYTSVVFNNKITRRRKDFSKILFKSSKYLDYFINNLKKRKGSLKIYFRTYNRNFYDYVRNFRTKKNPVYRVPLNYSYYKRKTLFFKKGERFLSKYPKYLVSYLRRVTNPSSFTQFTRLVVKRFFNPIVSPIAVNINKIYVKSKLNLKYLANKTNLNFYSNEKSKDYDFSFFDIKEKFNFNFTSNVRKIKNKKKYRLPRRVVTFWNKNYFLKFRKTGYNNLVFRRTYRVRDNILKFRTWRNKFEAMSYFVFNPRFWNIKAYDTMITGFKAGYLNGKGHRSNIKHYQVSDLIKKRRKWRNFKYISKTNEKYFFRNYFNNNDNDSLVLLNNRKIFKLQQKRNSNVYNAKNILNNYIFSKFTPNLNKNEKISTKTSLANKYNFAENMLFGSYLNKNFYLNKAFFKKVILNFKERDYILKHKIVPNKYLNFYENINFLFTKKKINKAFVKNRKKIIFSFFFKMHFTKFYENYKNSFLISKSKGNFYLKKKAFISILDHLSSYRFKFEYILPSSYRFFIRKNKYFISLKSNLHEKKFFYMSKFFFKYLNIYSDFLDFAARLQRESFFHKKFRKNMHVKFFFYRFFNRKFSNSILLDKNFNYFNLIFNRNFPKDNYKNNFNNEFVRFFLKYRRYRYNKHQYSRFRNPKYFSLMNNNYKYFDFIKEKQKYLIKTKNYPKKKKKAISKKMSQDYNIFLNKIWNVVNIKRKKNKSKFSKKNLISLYKSKKYNFYGRKFISKQLQKTLLNLEIKKFFKTYNKYSKNSMLSAIDFYNFKNNKDFNIKKSLPNEIKKSLYNVQIKNFLKRYSYFTKKFRNPQRESFFIANFIKDVDQKDYKKLIKKNRMIEFLELSKKKKEIINEKLKLLEKINIIEKNSKHLIEINKKIKKIKKKIIKDFYGLALDYDTLAYSRDSNDNPDLYKQGVLDTSQRAYLVEGDIEEDLKDVTTDIYGEIETVKEKPRSYTKNLKNPQTSKRIFSLKNYKLVGFDIDEGLTRNLYSLDKDYTGRADRQLILNFNRNLTPFAWRNYNRSSSRFRKTLRGFNQFFRRTFFKRRSNNSPFYEFRNDNKYSKNRNNLDEEYEKKKKKTNLNYLKKKQFSHYTQFMESKNFKSDTDSFIKKSFPTETIKHKLWSKNKRKKQKIFILNFPKTKKYVGFQYLYNSRFSYNRGQKNYYRDRSFQNVVFDQNFKAQKFFEIMKARKIRKKKIKHINYNRSRNIRSAIFESRLKTRYWLRNKYYTKIKPKPGVFLNYKIPGTYENLTRNLKQFSYKDFDYKELTLARRKHEKKRKNKLLRKFNIISKITKIPRFAYLKRNKNSFGSSYGSTRFLLEPDREGFSYSIPFSYSKMPIITIDNRNSSDEDRYFFKTSIMQNIIKSKKKNQKLFSKKEYSTRTDIDETRKFKSVFSDYSEILDNIINSDESVKNNNMTKQGRMKDKNNKEQLKFDKKNAVIYKKRFLKNIKEYGFNFADHNEKALKKRSKSKTRGFYSYRSNFGMRKKSRLLDFYYKISAKNNLFLFPSLYFKEELKKNNYTFLKNLNENILFFFEKHSNLDKIRKNNLLFYLKYKSFVLDNITNKKKKIKLAWFFLKSFQENKIFNKLLLSQVKSEKFGNFYIVDNQFTYGKKLNNYIAKEKLHSLEFDLLYDSRRFKTRYYRRRVPFKTIVSAKSHYANYESFKEYDSVYTSPSKYLTYMLGYPSLNKNKNKYIKEMKIDSLKRKVYFQNLFNISEYAKNNDKKNLKYLNETNKKVSKSNVTRQNEDKIFNLHNVEEVLVDDVNDDKNDADFLNRKANLSTEPRLQMNYKREHFKHYYFYTSKRQRYGEKFISKMSKACIIRIDVLLLLHVIRGFIYYFYRFFILYLYFLKYFVILFFFMIFYKIFVFFWIKNVLPNLIFLRNIYFLSNNLVERKFLNTYNDFYKEASYKNPQFFFKKKSRIYKTEFFNKKKYFDKSNKELSYFYLNDKYFVRNYFFKYSKEYKKTFIKIWVRGFVNTLKDTILTGVFIFLYFAYKIVILTVNFILNFFFKYIIGEILIWFFFFFNLLIKRINYYNAKNEKGFVLIFNIVFAFLSFIFRKIIYIFLLFFKIIFYFFIFILYSIFIFSYLKYYNLTLTELPSNILVLFLHAFLVFSVASISKNIKNLFVESNLNNVFPESLFSIGKEDNETALSSFFEMDHTYYPENHFIDYDKLMYSVVMDKALGTGSDQNPSTYYLGSYLDSKYAETSFSSFPTRFKYSIAKRIIDAINPVKSSFRDEDIVPSLNFVTNRNYIIPNEISQKMTDSNPIKNFFYRSTIIPILDIVRLTNLYNEKSAFLNFKQIYTLKFKFLTDYREYYKVKNRKKNSLNKRTPNFIKNYWAQRIKLKRNQNLHESSKIQFKLYENKIYKINNFNFFTFKNYKIVPKILNPYKKYLVLIYLLQFREYNRIQELYTGFLKDIYYPFAFQDGILWDDLFDNFDFSNRSIWPSSDFGLFFQRKFREELLLQNKIKEDVISSSEKDSNSLLFLLKNRDYRPDYKTIYKRYQNSWFLDYDKIEYVKDIDRFEEFLKVFTNKESNRIITIFEDDEDDTQSMIEEQPYIMDETDLSVYYDDHIFTMEDSSLFDFDSLSTYNIFLNKLNIDFINSMKINNLCRKKAFEKVFLEEYKNNEKFLKKSNFKYSLKSMDEKFIFKSNKDKLMRKIYKEFLIYKKNIQYDSFLKNNLYSDFKYKFRVDKKTLQNMDRKKDYETKIYFGIESGSLLFRGSFLDPRVSPKRIHNILKQNNDIEFQDNNWFKNLVEKRILVDTSYNNENYLFKNEVSMSEIDSILFCDVRNEESALGRFSDYGASSFWDDHVWITSSSEFRNAVTEFMLTLEKKYKIQYDIGIFNKYKTNKPLTLSTKKFTKNNNRKKISRIQYFKKDPLDNILSKKFTDDEVHSLDFESYRHRGQFLDFPSDFEALNKQVSFVPITQIVSINDINISKFKVWFKEIFWYQMYDNRFKRAFFEDFINICEFLDLRHFPVLNLEESQRLWSYLGCTEEEWDTIDVEPTNITVPFGSDEIIFFFLLAYFINSVPTTSSVGHPRTLYALEDSSKIAIYYRNFTFYKIYDFLKDFFRLFILSIHWSKDFVDFLNLYKYPVERITGTYTTYPYIPYNKFFNPFRKYWFNPHALDFEATWSFQSYFMDIKRNIYPQNLSPKMLYKINWTSFENDFKLDSYSLPLHRLGPIRNYYMNKKDFIFFSSNSSEIGWNDRGFGMNYFARYNSLASLPQNNYFNNYRIPLNFVNVLKKTANKFRYLSKIKIIKEQNLTFLDVFHKVVNYLDEKNIKIQKIASRVNWEPVSRIFYPKGNRPLYNLTYDTIIPKIEKSVVYLKKIDKDYKIAEKYYTWTAFFPRENFNKIVKYIYYNKIYNYDKVNNSIIELFRLKLKPDKIGFSMTDILNKIRKIFKNDKTFDNLNKSLKNYLDFFYLKINSRRFNMLEGFTSNLFLSKRILRIRKNKIRNRSDKYRFLGNFNMNITNIYNKMDRGMKMLRTRERKKKNRYYNLIVTPVHKRYTIANYFPEPLLHTPSVALSNFRSRILFNYDWFYIKCFLTVLMSTYLILSMFFTPIMFIFLNIAHYFFVKILWYLSFIFSDIFILNIYDFVCFICLTFKANYLLLFKLYFLLIFDFFYYFFDLYFLMYLFKFLIFTNFIELLNVEYWLSIVQFLSYCLASVLFTFFNFEFLNNIIFYLNKTHFFFEHFFFYNISYSYLFSSFFDFDIKIFFILSSFFYYPYFLFPHLYISFVHFFMVFFHIFVNILFLGYFSVYILFIDIKPYFFLFFDFLSEYYYYQNIVFKTIYFLSYYFVQIILYFILLFSFLFFYLFYLIHMFLQLLSLFYVIYFYFT